MCSCVQKFGETSVMLVSPNSSGEILLHHLYESNPCVSASSLTRHPPLFSNSRKAPFPAIISLISWQRIVNVLGKVVESGRLDDACAQGNGNSIQIVSDVKNFTVHSAKPATVQNGVTE